MCNKDYMYRRGLYDSLAAMFLQLGIGDCVMGEELLFLQRITLEGEHKIKI